MKEWLPQFFFVGLLDPLAGCPFHPSPLLCWLCEKRHNRCFLQTVLSLTAIQRDGVQEHYPLWQVWVVVCVIPQTLQVMFSVWGKSLTSWPAGGCNSGKHEGPSCSPESRGSLSSSSMLEAPVCAQTIMLGHALVVQRGELFFGRSHHFRFKLILTGTC